MHNPAAETKGLWGGRHIAFPVLPSTNQWVLDHASELLHGDIVTAQNQTCGRGRFGRTWHSGSGLDLCLTVVLFRTAIAESVCAQLTQRTALGVCSALLHAGVKAQVKWPNDIWVNRRKIAGILAESATSSPLIALGIGMNVNSSFTAPAPCEWTAAPTSVAMETGATMDPQVLRELLLPSLHEWLSDSPPRDVPSAWKLLDALTEEPITLQTDGGPVPGIYLGIDEAGRLRLRHPDGREQCFWSGDVSLRRA